jgi:hypothetical protein
VDSLQNRKAEENVTIVYQVRCSTCLLFIILTMPYHVVVSLILLRPYVAEANAGMLLSILLVSLQGKKSRMDLVRVEWKAGF